MALTQMQQIQSLGEALAWLERELNWGVKPASLSHLCGRITKATRKVHWLQHPFRMNSIRKRVFMHKIIKYAATPSSIAIIVSALTVLLLFVWEGHKGLGLGDEGFLWYGAQRVMVGEVPIRDFMAYEPARYYWAAGLMTLRGDNGLVSLRIAIALFQWLGLLIALQMLVRSFPAKDRGSIIFVVVAAVTFAAWMVPRHKLFDISICIFLAWGLSYLISDPKPRRYFFCGLIVGLVTIFGRNHGLYGVVASTAVIFWLGLRRSVELHFVKGAALWFAGMLVGLIPLVAMSLFVPGFAGALVESIRLLIKQGSTNLPLPVPWPWTISWHVTPIRETFPELCMGLFFVGVLLFGIGAVFCCFQQRLKGGTLPSTFVAAAFLGIPYAQFAYSRSDLNHLAQGIFPFLLGCFVLIGRQETWRRWILAVGLCAMSLCTTAALHPGWQCRHTTMCVPIDVSGDQIRVDTDTATDVVGIKQLVQRYAPAGQSFVITPYWPGAYALIGRRSPMWDIYALVPRPDGFEQKEIERIQDAKPSFVLVMDEPLDGRDALRFSRTHSQVYRYITTNFRRVPDSVGLPYDLYLPPKQPAESR
jgi:hypothetical protein